MRARAAVSAALAIVLAIGVAGCTLITPQATTKKYSPGFGVSATLDKVKVINVVAISGGGSNSNPKKIANLIFGAINNTDQTVTLTVQYQAGDAQKTLTVEAHPGLTKVGYDGSKQLLLTGFTARAGSLTKVYFQYGSAQGDQLSVPVLDSSWSIYSTLSPTPRPKPTPKPSTTGTATPTPSATPAG